MSDLTPYGEDEGDDEEEREREYGDLANPAGGRKGDHGVSSFLMTSEPDEVWDSMEGWWEPDGTFHKYQCDDLPVGAEPSDKPARLPRATYWPPRERRKQKLDELRRVHDRRTSLERHEFEVICRARIDDATWADIGDQLGMSRQAAHRRYAHIVSEIEKERRVGLHKSRGSRRGTRR
jgi:hypothetical protein